MCVGIETNIIAPSSIYVGCTLKGESVRVRHSKVKATSRYSSVSYNSKPKIPLNPFNEMERYGVKGKKHFTPISIRDGTS